MVHTTMTSAERMLAEKHLYLVPQMVFALTRSYSYITKDEFEELTQRGYMSLCIAAMKYDEKRAFIPYARVAIRNAIYDYWRDCKRRNDMFCPLDVITENSDGSSYEQTCQSAVDMCFLTEQEALQNVSSNYLIQLRKKGQFCDTIQKGIDALCLKQHGYTTKEIALYYGVSDNHVRAWISKARKILQQDQEFLQLLA